MEPENPPERRSLSERLAASLPALVRFVRGRMGPDLAARESASDIAQSTARELLEAGTFEDRGDPSLQRWLRVAAEHKLRRRARHWRAYGRGAAQELTASREPVPKKPTGPSRGAIAAEEEALLEKAIAQLSDEHRHVLRRVHDEGASYEEVGLELGRSSEAVRKLYARVLARLAASLRRLDED